MKCDECTCSYESCSCKLPGSKCAYETDDKKYDGGKVNEKKINQDGKIFRSMNDLQGLVSEMLLRIGW